MSSISISVKTDINDDMGALSLIDPTLTIDDVLDKIKDDLGLEDTVVSLVRLMPGGTQMHSKVLNPSLLTETGMLFFLCDQYNNHSTIISHAIFLVSLLHLFL